MAVSVAFSDADHAAAAAYLSAVAAVIRLQVSTEELETRLEQCREFAVGHAYAAFMRSLAGNTGRITRRERQLVEILLLSVDGDRRRAAALATEHVDEFPADAPALATIERWFGERDVR